MSITTEPAFYDKAMTDADEPAMIELEQSPWLELYRQASWLIPHGHLVIDLGCGTGRFAEQLRRRGHGPYQGIDFSPAAIAECERYVMDHNADTDWTRTFEVGDLRDWQPSRELPGNATFTCLETLEHLEDDIGLVRKIPVGHVFIFSVPNYGGEAHLRWFQNVGDVWSRYGHLLEFTNWTRLGSGQYHVHLYRAIRRETW